MIFSTRALMPEYRIIENKNPADLNADAASGWFLFHVQDMDAGNVVLGIEKTDNSFVVVGQATTATSTSEFLINKSWTYGEMISVAIWFLILTLGLFAFMFAIFKKKRKNL